VFRRARTGRWALILARLVSVAAKTVKTSSIVSSVSSSQPEAGETPASRRLVPPFAACHPVRSVCR